MSSRDLSAALLAVGVLLAAGCEKPQPREAQASERKTFLELPPDSPNRNYIKIEKIEETDPASQVLLTGKVTFDEDHTQRVSTPIDGRVQDIRVQIGEHVKEGQTLIELTSPHVGQLQADALKAQHDFEVASKALERAAKLKTEGAMSEKEAALIDADYKKAKADVARTSAQLRALGVNATDPTVRVEIRAQISGTVVERNVLRGQEVRADQVQPLVTVTNLDHVWILGDVYEQDLGLVQVGAEVSARVAAYPGETFPGKVTSIGEVVDSLSRTIKIRCVVPNKEQKLKPEMFAKLDLSTKVGTKCIAVPPKAVLAEGDKSKVVVVEGTKFILRDVEVGPEVNGRVRVLSGLKSGDEIVTDGALFLKREIEEL
jgi:membrane fusion protein, heavy metal efflux system